jgi:hypothetical protein
MADVTIVKSGTCFLVRAHTEDGKELLDDMFGWSQWINGDPTVIGWGNVKVVGRERWPERDGARVVGANDLNDEFFEEAENREIVLRML